MRDQILKVLVPLASWGLNLAFPVVPAFVWNGLLTAVIDGDITLSHITEFLKAHGIEVYAPRDIQTPDAQPVPGTNLVSGGYHDEGPRSM